MLRRQLRICLVHAVADIHVCQIEFVLMSQYVSTQRLSLDDFEGHVNHVLRAVDFRFHHRRIPLLSERSHLGN
jgi:hypothetical protein